MKYLLILIPFFMISCSSSDNKITFPAGSYTTGCLTEDSNSFQVDATIANDYKSSITVTTTYTGVTDCSGTGSTETDTDIGTMVFSNEDLGGGVSYFTETGTDDGEPYTDFVPFLYKDNKLYIGTYVETLTNPKTDFAAFIANPATTAEAVFTKK